MSRKSGPHSRVYFSPGRRAFTMSFCSSRIVNPWKALLIASNLDHSSVVRFTALLCPSLCMQRIVRGSTRLRLLCSNIPWPGFDISWTKSGWTFCSLDFTFHPVLNFSTLTDKISFCRNYRKFQVQLLLFKQCGSLLSISRSARFGLLYRSC